MSQAAPLQEISLRATEGNVFSRRRPPGKPARVRASRRAEPGAASGTLDPRLAPYALWLLRLTVGVVFLQHVMRMVFGYEPADTSQLFALPPGVSPFAVAWEAAVGLALVYGIWPRLAAVVGAATLSVAAIASHASAATPYAWQMPVLWIAALLAFALAGDGAFTLVASPSGPGGEHRH